MPELPEVETVRAFVEATVGCVLERVELRRTDLRYPIPVAAVRGLAGGSITAVRRRAKYLLIDITADGRSPQTLLIHLGMSGRLLLSANPDDAWLKHEHARFELAGVGAWRRLRFIDARRFGAIDCFQTARESEHFLLRQLGPEPLGGSFDGAYLHRVAAGRKVAIKQLIMNSHCVVGVGNIYASEACWRARISPFRRAGRMSRATAARVVGAIKDVLAEAIEMGGTTLRDFVGGDAAPGYFQQRLDVYGRAGERCRRCGDGTVKKAVQQARMSYWCPNCQY